MKYPNSGKKKPSWKYHCSKCDHKGTSKDYPYGFCSKCSGYVKTGEILNGTDKPKLEILVIIDDGNISRLVANQPNNVKILELNRESDAEDWHNEYETEVDPQAISEFHESRE